MSYERGGHDRLNKNSFELGLAGVRLRCRWGSPYSRFVLRLNLSRSQGHRTHFSHGMCRSGRACDASVSEVSRVVRSTSSSGLGCPEGGQASTKLWKGAERDLLDEVHIAIARMCGGPAWFDAETTHL